ncbi:VanZ family protein [Corynebacterium sp. 335C]
MHVIAERFQWSLVLGPALVALLLLPLLVGHHRRFGGVEGARLGWSLAAVVYAAALGAFTILPIPDFTPGFCAARAGESAIHLDPTELPRTIARVVDRSGPAALVRAWPVQEAAMNVALFVPLGLFTRRLLEWRRRRVLLLALATSLLIEVTQLTGNWGLAPCPYRHADVTDLMTNVLGAAIGLLLAAALPKPRRTLLQMEARRDVVRPVTASRRLTGMAVDACALALAAAAGAVVTLPWTGTGATLAVRGVPVPALGALTGCLALIVGAAAIGAGGSVGQRAVHLRPVPGRPGALGRAALVLRALAGQGVAVALVALGLPWALAGLAWAAVCAASVLGRVEGLTGVVAGCRMRDARAGA